MGTTARLLFAAVGVIALCTLAVQLNLNVDRYGDVGTGLWKMARYFTLWTAALVALSTLYIAATAHVSSAQAGVAAAIVLFASVVGVVYHILLRPTDDPQGLWWHTNLMLHYVLPGGVALLWLFAAPKGRLLWRAPIVWLIFPMTYITATAMRGAYFDEYPYFFLDIGENELSTVGVYAGGLFTAFLVGGYCLVALDRMMANGRAATEDAGA